MRLFGKILIFMFLVGFIPILTMSLIYFVRIEEQAKYDTIRSYRALTGILAREVNRTLDEGYRYIQLIATNPKLKAAGISRKEQQAELDTLFGYNHIFKDISFLDTDGNARASVLYSFRGFWKNTSWFKRAVQGSVTVSAAHADLYPFDVVVTVLTPVRDDEGAIVGVVAGQMDMEKVKATINTAEIGDGSEIHVIDSETRVIASTAENELFEPVGFSQLERELASVASKWRQ